MLHKLIYKLKIYNRNNKKDNKNENYKNKSTTLATEVIEKVEPKPLFLLHIFFHYTLLAAI
jgi:hypothetical protein